MQNAKQQPVRFVLLFFAVCFVFRIIEYMFIRTDQGIIGEAFIHKLIGIFMLAMAVKLLQYAWADIGLRAQQIIRHIFLGLLLGGVVFTVAYVTEILMQMFAGNTPTLQFYVTSYAIQGNRGMQDGTIFILMCIVGNIINVVMEEGVFRGLFLRLMEEKYSFAKACIFSSVLFGVWHIAQPLRNAIDGTQSLMGAIMSGLLLVVTSTLLGIQYSMLYKITGSLWAGMAAHFVNNAIINLLHVVTTAGVDELQTVRITIAQTLSFIIVLIFFLFHRYWKARTPVHIL